MSPKPAIFSTGLDIVVEDTLQAPAHVMEARRSAGIGGSSDTPPVFPCHAQP
jgi:hypothetical protein